MTTIEELRALLEKAHGEPVALHPQHLAALLDIAEALGSVKVADSEVRAALDSLGRPGTLAEAIVWAVANAYLDGRAALARLANTGGGS